jgi:hypothetical protein
LELQGVKDTLAKQSESSFPIHLALDELQLGHMSFNHSVVNLPDQPSLYWGLPTSTVVDIVEG